MKRLVMRAFFCTNFFPGRQWKTFDSGGPRRMHLGCGRGWGHIVSTKKKKKKISKWRINLAENCPESNF